MPISIPMHSNNQEYVGGFSLCKALTLIRMAGGVFIFDSQNFEQINCKMPEVKIYFTLIYSSQNMFESYLVKGFYKTKAIFQ
jgi:hypothetical protein